MSLLESTALNRTLDPTVEPILLADVKTHVRVDHDDEDGLLTRNLVAARAYIENAYKMALMTQTWGMHLDWFPSGIVEIPRPPLQSITSIAYEDEAGDTQTLDSSKYQVDVNSRPGRVVFEPDEVWPATEVGRLAAVTITFVAGYGATEWDNTTEGSVPASVVEALLLLVGHWYLDREAVLTGTISKEIEFAVKALMSSEATREAW